MKMNKKYLCLILITILILLPLSIVFTKVKATIESSYQSSYRYGFTEGKVDGLTAVYGVDDACYNKKNYTGCSAGYEDGWDKTCPIGSKEFPNTGDACPMSMFDGKPFSYPVQALWYNTGHDPIDCQSHDPMCCELIGCPSSLNQEKYVGGFRPLIGTWNIVNETTFGSIDKNSTGRIVFLGDGTMEFRFPNIRVVSADGDRAIAVGGTWASDGHKLVIVWPLAWESMTFVEIGNDHIELKDDHGNRIHLFRLSETPMMVPYD
jgi:hypothetical protein